MDYPVGGNEWTLLYRENVSKVEEELGPGENEHWYHCAGSWVGRVPDQGVGQSSDTAAYYSGTSVGETFLRVFGSTLSGFRLFQNIPVKLLLYLLYTSFSSINLRLSYLQFVRLNTANPNLTNAKNRPSPN